MNRKTISTSAAPAAIGPYEQAIDTGSLIFTSGQIPMDPQTGNIVGETIEAQTEQVLKNLDAVLQAANLTFDQVVKTTVFLTDMALFSRFNEVYARYFTNEKPARSTVAVAALPLGSLVEIEAVAVR